VALRAEPSLESLYALILSMQMMGKNDDAQKTIDYALEGRDRRRYQHSRGLMWVMCAQGELLRWKGKDKHAVLWLEEARAMAMAMPPLQDDGVGEMIAMILVEDQAIILTHLAEAYEAVGRLKDAVDADMQVKEEELRLI